MKLIKYDGKNVGSISSGFHNNTEKNWCWIYNFQFMNKIKSVVNITFNI